MTRSVKSSLRTFQLFELFARRQCPLSTKEISESMDMPQSSTSILVQSMIKQGYLVRQTHSRKVYPTLRITMLGMWMQRRHEYAGRSARLLRELSIRTGEIAVLAMRNGIFSQYLLAQDGNSPERQSVESGMLYPLACCSTGWCLLSNESNSTIHAIARRTQAEADDPHWRETAKFALERVQETRKNGYAYSQGETNKTVAALAVSVPTAPGTYPLSVCVGGNIKRVAAKKEMILEALHDLVADVQFPREETQ